MSLTILSEGKRPIGFCLWLKTCVFDRTRSPFSGVSFESVVGALLQDSEHCRTDSPNVLCPCRNGAGTRGLLPLCFPSLECVLTQTRAPIPRKTRFCSLFSSRSRVCAPSFVSTGVVLLSDYFCAAVTMLPDCQTAVSPHPTINILHNVKI